LVGYLCELTRGGETMNNLAYLAIQFTTAIALYLVIFRIYLQP
jgi:hypothetical protein